MRVLGRFHIPKLPLLPEIISSLQNPKLQNFGFDDENKNEADHQREGLLVGGREDVHGDGRVRWCVRLRGYQVATPGFEKPFSI